MRPFDVLVIGGGPAGATAALLLARAGRSVAVLEKAAFPRRKVCGEFIAPPAAAFLRALGARLDPAVRRIALWTGDRLLQAPLPAPYASTSAREDLDTLLLQSAAAAGAMVYQPLKALSLERSRSGFLCETQSMTLEARLVIAAHGSWEPGALPTQARRSPPQASDLLAFKAHFRGASLPADTIALLPFPGGYGGALRLGDGRATFACCLRRDALESLRRPGLAAGESVLRHALRASAGLREAFAGAQRDGTWLAAGPLRPGVRPLHRDGVFAVGNAAGEVHPVVGQGISLAIRSAELLCRTLESGGSPRRYETQCRSLFARALRSSALIARLASQPVPAARLLAAAPWLLTLGARLAAPPRSWIEASAARQAARRRP
jgi:flavin-dependent dehydrogenase